IATVSIYVEPVAAGQSDGQEPPEGTSQLGTTHAFSRRSDGMQITVIGDVPAVTVKEIGMSVSRNGP
ncbi:MAG: MucB/RseB C-terminal domain-containing protein, partial [Xanthomonadales bacterium]|nr:MucB/RseB C-terminal domain-containing protein [Xanthomonadales bacterium]